MMYQLSENLNQKAKEYEDDRLREKIEERILMDSNDLTSSKNPDPSE